METQQKYLYYLTDEEILSSVQSQMIDQAKLRYSPLGKVFEKQTKIIEDHRKKQVQANMLIKN